jgi:DNA topoisomerase IB
MGDFGRELPGLRRHVDHDLDRPDLPRERALAAVIRLIAETLIRIGNEEYARQNQTSGLTTLRREHVKIEGPDEFMFEFRAKAGKEQRVRLADSRLARVVHACEELPGQELFGYGPGVARTRNPSIRHNLHCGPAGAPLSRHSAWIVSWVWSNVPSGRTDSSKRTCALWLSGTAFPASPTRAPSMR